MGGNMSRNKGQRGEREFAALLQPVINECFVENGFAPPLMKRNLQQTREGGYDLTGIDWMALEVKRQETLNLNSWWKQTLSQTQEGQTPVLAYRKNRTKWRVRLFVREQCGVGLTVEISFEDFVKYLKKRIAVELKSKSS